MNTVNALVCRQLAPSLAGVDNGTIDVGPPGAHEVQISVRAAALNFPDLLMTEGLYQHKPSLPFVPGMEGAGIVTALGQQVTDVAVGDSVRFSCRSGACAEQIVVPASDVWPLPNGFSFAQAAAFKVGALTAWVSLVRCGQLERDQILVVHGASGGMGLAAVQLGVHLGATVIASGTSQARLEPAVRCGAHHTVLADDQFRDRVRQIAPDGVDVVFDPVGGDAFDKSLRVMGWGGRLLVVGFASGRIPQLPVNIALIKGFSVVGVRAGEYGRRDPVRGAENDRAIQDLANAGALTPVIGASFPLHDGKAALQALRDRAAPGKIVVTMDG